MRASFSLFFLLGLTACGTSYQRPDVTAPATWRADEDQTAAWPSADWWQGFQSPQLNRFIVQAKNANDDIGAAIARVLEADAQARIAGAPLLPSLAASGVATRERPQPAPGGTPRTFSDFGAQLNASYELDFWGKNRSARNAAKAAAAASRYDRATVELTVMTSVATTYFQVLGLHERVRAAQNNLASAKKILSGLELQRKAGIANALDVAQQATTVATLYATIPALQQQMEQSIDALAILTGQPPPALNSVAGTLADLALPEVRPGLPSELLARRPDVAQAEAQLVAANANIGVARAAFFPSIALTGSDGFASTVLASLLDPVNRVFALSAGLTQPIFSGGALTGQLAYSKARYKELLAVYHKAVIAAFGNVEDALTAVQQNADQEQRRQIALEKAQRAYEISQAQLRAGVVNVLAVLNTQGALFAAKDALIQARLAHLQALVSLFSALGGGWQRAQES